MKFNWAVFKKGKAIYWVVGAVVLFVIFYLLASGGSKSSGDTASTGAGGITTINPGPSDAQLAAAAGITQAQLAANAATTQSNAELAAKQSDNAAAVAIANLQYQGSLADTQAGADVAKYLAATDAATNSLALTEQTRQMQIQGEYSFATAKVAAETNLAGQALQAQVLTTQLVTQAQMFGKSLDANTQALQIQSQNLVDQSLIAQIPTLKKKNRDDALLALASSFSNQGVPQLPNNGSSGQNLLN